MKQMKRVLAALLAIVLVITGLYIVPNNTKEVQAAKTTATGNGLNLYQTEYEWYYSRNKKFDRLPDTFEVTYRIPEGGMYRPGNVLGNGRFESSSSKETDCTYQLGFFQGMVPYLRITDATTISSTAKVNHGMGGHFYMFGEYEWPTGNVAPYVPSRSDAAKNEAYAKYVTQYDEYAAKFCTGEWIHLAIVNDVANNQMHCYVNGELFKTINECYTGSATFKTDYPLFVYGDRRGMNTQQFRGDIKNVAFYASARTASEIAEDKAGVDGSEANLMAAYNMDLGTAGAAYPTKIEDLSPNGYDLYEYFSDHFMSEAEKEALAPRGEYAYSMAVVGDPQIVTRDAAANTADKEKLNQLYQWVVDHTEDKNIQFTFHMGDSVDSFARAATQWPKAKEAAAIWNNAGIPYSVVRGNHDSVTDYLANYDWDTYKNKVDGSFGGNMLNTYQKFSVGDIKYLVVNLDFGAEDAALEWACDVVEANPEYNVIVTTHGYLDETGKLLTTGHGAEPTKPSGEGYAEDNDGVDFWNKFVSKYENITLVLSGHVGTEQVVMNQREGKNGHVVTEMLINPQLTDRWLGLNGIVTMLYFSEDGKTVKVENYSVLRDTASNGAFAYYDIGKAGAVAGTGELASHFTVTLDTVSNSVFECGDEAVALSYGVLDVTGNIPKPTLDNYKDYLFAGWYTSPACTMDTAIRDLGQVTSASYAKFIPKEMLNIKAQTAQTAESDGDYLMRFISSVEGLNYAQVGFEVSYEGLAKPKRNQTNTVYERIDSEFQSIAYKFGPKVVDTSSEYFVTAKMYADPDVLYTVRAYIVTLDGTVVYGPSRFLGATDGLSTTSVNLSFDAKNVSAYEVGKTCAVTYGQATTTATVIGIEGNSVHVRVQVADATSLDSVTKFTFAGGECTTWRNLYTTHKTPDSTANADISWYTVIKEVYPQENEFVIATTADLYGLASLVSSGNTFLNSKAMLCADLVVNADTPNNAHLSASWNNYAPDHAWTPIGNADTKFAGTFDGQGHSLSGIYSSSTGNLVGLFGYTSQNATICDLKLTESYFGGKDNIGTISAYGGGTISRVYSNSVAYGTNSHVGGLFGLANEPLVIEEAEFAGTAEAEVQMTGGVLGYLNGVTVDMKNVVFSGITKASRTNSTGSSGNIGGLCGYSTNQGTLHAIDCIITGEVQHSSQITGGYGAAFGRVGAAGDKLVLTNVYAEAASVDNNKIYGSNASGVTIDVAGAYFKDDLTGQLAYTNTEKLGFKINAKDENPENIWIARENNGPTLAIFAEEADLKPLTSYLKADTEWFTNPQGNVGTEAAPYLLKDADDYYGLVSLIDGGETFAGKHLAFAYDITFNTNTPKNADKLASWNSYQPQFALNTAGKGATVEEVTNLVGFAGTIDGRNHELSGIYILEETKWTGIFGYTLPTAQFKNFKLTNSYVEGLGNSGGIVGQGGGTFVNVESDAVVVGSSSTATHYIGGFIGLVDLSSATFQDCKNSGDICVDNSGQALGGFVGNVLGSSIEITNGLYDGEITCSGGYAGGFVGNTNGKTGTTTVRLTDSIFSGKIHGKQRNFGGLIGSTQNSTDVDILNCISSGTVESSYSTSATGSAIYLGGVIGSIKTGSVIDIQESAVTGSVKTLDSFTGTCVGGIGNVDKGTVTMSKVLVSADISASQQVAGFIGQINTSGNATITMTDCQFDGSVEAFAPSGHLNAGILVGNASGYLASGTHRTVTITATRCLVTGGLSVERSSYAGKLIGKIQGNNSTLDCIGGVYIINDSAKFPSIVTTYLNKTNHTGTGWKGTAGAGITDVTTANLTGAAAVTNVPLLGISTASGSTSTWVATKTGVPTLRIFADTADIYTVE